MSAVLVLASCSNDKDIYSGVTSATEGAVKMSVALAAEVADDQTISIKVYNENAEGERQLVRRYTSLSDVPEYLTLLADNYIAVVEVGEKRVASFDEKCYRGEKEFTVSNGNVANVTVDCSLLSTIVAVDYDATVGEKLEAGYNTVVAVADEEQLAKIIRESAGVIDEKSLRTWDSEDVLAVYDSLVRAHESINKLALVPESF